MRFISYKHSGKVGLAALRGDKLFTKTADQLPRDLMSLLAAGGDALQRAYNEMLAGQEIDPDGIEYLPPFAMPEKIICVGLNYKDHASESGFQPPTYPALFSRFNSSLIGHKAPIIRPDASEQLDYEGEVVAVIGQAGRNIPVQRALEHVADYSIFNDASVRDFQFLSAQWMIGKNFDGTGAFGPAFVTADEVPDGARGLRLQTRLNGTVLQEANTTDMIFDIQTLVHLLSIPFMLRPGDLIVAGTPSGVGLARNPKIFMKPGDICEVEIEGLGTLINPIAQQQ